MNNPQFYIFGVPDGFDIYNATPEKRDFFLSFYNGKYICRSKMMVIYRSEDNNEVTYVYFRGNILAANGRPGSFLGMALTFQNGMYCTNAKMVHDLFEGMYIAITNNKLLTTDVDKNQYQARYLVTRFVEQTSNIAALEQFVADQIDKWPKGSLVFTDNTFSNDPRSIELDLSNISWDHVIPNMKAVSWVYLVGLDTRIPQPSPHKVDYNENLRTYENTFRQICSESYGNSQNDLVKRKERLNTLLGEVTKLNNMWPSNEGRTLQQQIDGQLNSIEKQLNSVVPPPPTPGPLDMLIRIEKDFDFESSNSYGNKIKSLQRHLGIMRNLKERLERLDREQLDGERVEKITKSINNEIEYIKVQIDKINKRNKLIALVIIAFVVVALSAVFISKCSNKSNENDNWETKKEEFNSRIVEINNAVDSYKNLLDTIKNTLKEQQSYKNAEKALSDADENIQNARNCLDAAKNSSFDTLINSYLTVADKKIKEFSAEWLMIKKVPEQLQTNKKEESADKKTKDHQSGTVKVKEKEKKEESKIDNTKWAWKITVNNIKVKWSETELHVQSGTPITITVYNNGKETPVVWEWSGATSIQTPGVRSKNTELSSITITRNRNDDKGLISFYPKGQPDPKMNIKLMRE